ncbi:2TM domain-containing protein [Methanobrevibacter sp.]
MNARQKAEKIVDAKIKFQENLYKYLIVNGVLAIFSFIFFDNYTLLLSVMFFWGIFLVIDFLKAYPLNNIVGEGYREEMIQKEISKMGD